MVRPRKQDVLFGRGKKYYCWPGNVRMRQICCSFRNKFKAATKRGKEKITWECLTKIMDGGNTSFLLLTAEGEWYKKTDTHKQVYAKVAHVLRVSNKEVTKKKSHKKFVEDTHADDDDSLREFLEGISFLD